MAQIPQNQTEWDDLVYGCINATRPTRMPAIVERIERKTGCQLLSLSPVMESGKRLVASGRVKIVRDETGAAIGAQRIQ